jgi:hypothetical protein
MARFYGNVGYGESIEEPPNSGVWVDKIAEYTYQGDVIRNSKHFENTEKINRDVGVGNSISIVADELANKNFMNIKYIEWAGVLWTVNTVEVRSPRLILSLGSVYNGPKA